MEKSSSSIAEDSWENILPGDENPFTFDKNALEKSVSELKAKVSKTSKELEEQAGNISDFNKKLDSFYIQIVQIISIIFSVIILSFGSISATFNSGWEVNDVLWVLLVLFFCSAGLLSIMLFIVNFFIKK